MVVRELQLENNCRGGAGAARCVLHVAGERHAPRNRVLVLFSFQLLAALSQLLGGSLACIDSGPVQWPSSGLEWGPACLLARVRAQGWRSDHLPDQAATPAPCRPPLAQATTSSSQSPKVNNRPSSPPSPRLHLAAFLSRPSTPLLRDFSI